MAVAFRLGNRILNIVGGLILKSNFVPDFIGFETLFAPESVDSGCQVSGTISLSIDHRLDLTLVYSLTLTL